MYISLILKTVSFIKDNYRALIWVGIILSIVVGIYSIYLKIESDKKEYANIIALSESLKIENAQLEIETREKDDIIKRQEESIKQKDAIIKELRSRIKNLNTKVDNQKKSLQPLKTAKDFEDKFKEIYKCASGC